MAGAFVFALNFVYLYYFVSVFVFFHCIQEGGLSDGQVVF